MLFVFLPTSYNQLRLNPRPWPWGSWGRRGWQTVLSSVASGRRCGCTFPRPAGLPARWGTPYLCVVVVPLPPSHARLRTHPGVCVCQRGRVTHVTHRTLPPAMPIAVFSLANPLCMWILTSLPAPLPKRPWPWAAHTLGVAAEATDPRHRQGVCQLGLNSDRLPCSCPRGITARGSSRHPSAPC